jgi:hypothetical protein
MCDANSGGGSANARYFIANHALVLHVVLALAWVLLTVGTDDAHHATLVVIGLQRRAFAHEHRKPVLGCIRMTIPRERNRGVRFEAQ